MTSRIVWAPTALPQRAAAGKGPVRSASTECTCSRIIRRIRLEARSDRDKSACAGSGMLPVRSDAPRRPTAYSVQQTEGAAQFPAKGCKEVWDGRKGKAGVGKVRRKEG